MLPAALRSRGRCGWCRTVGRPAGLLAALSAPPVAAYTAVLLSDTATPSWHEAYRELPVRVRRARRAPRPAASGWSPRPCTRTARRAGWPLGGAVVELAMERQMERSMGMTAEPLHHGKAGRLMRAAKALTVAGAAGSLLAGRSRDASACSPGRR